MSDKTPWILAVLAVASLAGCGPKPPPPAAPTIQALMAEKIDPNADALWAAVGTEVTDKGTIEHAPATDAEWAAVEARAQALYDGARILAKARAVGGAAHSPLADSDTPGTRTPAQITADIQADPAKFAAAAGRLGQAAQEALDGVRGRDKAKIMAAGEHLDAACEACHAAYWYPRGQAIPLPDYETFGRQAVNR